MPTTTTEPRLAVRGLRKYFAASGVLAVDDVSLDVHAGEVVAIIGENGTGKSTLMNLLFGVHAPDSGDVFVDGRRVQIRGTQDAIDAGLGMVHQHFELVPSFTVAQNVLLGREPLRGVVVDDRAAAARVTELAAAAGFAIDARQRVGGLPIGTQQRVEILKALAADARVLILDEPTAVLTPAEADELLAMVRRLAADGRSVVFISHKLPEVQAIADRIIVMRRGRVVAEFGRGEADDEELARAMVGRDVLLGAPPERASGGQTVLEVADAAVAAAADGSTGLRGADLVVRTGEIVGIAGVSGNGQDELVDALAALRRLDRGRIRVGGAPLGRTPAAARAAGIVHIAADRMHVGLNLDATLEENAVATAYRTSRFSTLGVVRRRARRRFAEQVIRDYEVRGAAPARVVRSLSGGNLQKIVIGRELDGEPRVVLANQPTRGLDVGSIEFVHASLVRARDAGAAVVLVSAELDEILTLSDRVAVMYDGCLIGPFPRQDVDRERLGRLMAGGGEPT